MIVRVAGVGQACTKPTTPLLDILRASAWADCLSAEQLQRTTAETIVRNVPAGAFVCRTGEPVEHWIGVIEGLLKVSIASAAGRSMTLTGVAAGGWFGEGSMLKTESRRYDVIALRATRVACMPRTTFNWLCQTSVAFNRFLLTQINERCGQFIAMLQAERLFDRDARVAQCLWVLFNPHLYPGFGPHVEISQEEIGHLSGLSRQHVNKALHALEQRGLLQVDHHRGITVTDLQGLGNFGR
jgi:CRP/FNR family cyclic AMP-dependent transcriptional regulator